MGISSAKKVGGRVKYDWRPLRRICMENPGQWFKEDDPDRPKTTGHQIRDGSPAIFQAGAFDAAYRKEGTFVRYLGVPLEPWYGWDPDTFERMERTLDPELFPAHVSPEFRSAATAYTPGKAIKRERKRRAAQASTDPEEQDA